MKKTLYHLGLIVLILTLGKTTFAKENHFEPVLQELTADSPGYERLSVSLNGDLYVYSYEGQLLPNYPLSLTKQVFTSSPLVADINQDGSKDIIVLSRDISNNYTLHAISYDQQIIASKNLGTEDIYHDPLLVHPYSGANDIILIDNSGLVSAFFLENGQWSEEKITDPGAFVSASYANLDKNEFILTFQNQPKAEVYEYNNRWKLKKTFNLDSPFIYPVIFNGTDTFFGINSSNQLSAFDNYAGATKGGFPVNLDGTPIASPDLINIDDRTQEDEITVLLADGKRQTFNSLGDELDWKLASKSLINRFVDTADSGHLAIYSTLYNFANELNKNNYQLVVSELSKLKIALITLSSAPTQDDPILSSEFGKNTIDEYLILTPQNIHDPDGDSVKQIINWNENLGKFNTTLNMPFEAGLTKDYSNNKHSILANSSNYSANTGYDGFGSASFNENSSITIAHQDSLNPENSSLNISFWIKTTNQDQTIIYKEDPTTRDKFEIATEAGIPKITLANDQKDILLSGNGPINDGQWHHIFLSINRDEARFILYIDGNFASFNNLFSIGSISPQGDLKIGDGFIGNLDDIVFYKGKGFTESQVNEIYKNGFYKLLAEYTEANEVWQACIDINDKHEDGETKCSNQLTIELPNQINIENTSPENGATINPYDTYLRWDINNGNHTDFQEFEVYLAENNPSNLQLIGSTPGTIKYYHLKIAPNTTYYWQIVGLVNNIRIEGEIWSFRVN